MREIRTSGSEGGVALRAIPTPIVRLIRHLPPYRRPSILIT